MLKALNDEDALDYAELNIYKIDSYSFGLTIINICIKKCLSNPFEKISKISHDKKIIFFLD